MNAHSAFHAIPLSHQAIAACLCSHSKDDGHNSDNIQSLPLGCWSLPSICFAVALLSTLFDTLTRCFLLLLLLRVGPALLGAAVIAVPVTCTVSGLSPPA